MPKNSRAPRAQLPIADSPAMVALRTLKAALLQLPMCITAEDDDNIVVAVRISRRMLADNHLFLAALSDAAAGVVQ